MAEFTQNAADLIGFHGTVRRLIGWIVNLRADRDSQKARANLTSNLMASLRRNHEQLIAKDDNLERMYTDLREKLQEADDEWSERVNKLEGETERQRTAIINFYHKHRHRNSFPTAEDLEGLRKAAGGAPNGS